MCKYIKNTTSQNKQNSEKSINNIRIGIDFFLFLFFYAIIYELGAADTQKHISVSHETNRVTA